MSVLIIRLGEDEWYDCIEHGTFDGVCQTYIETGRVALIIPKGADIQVEELSSVESKVQVIRESTGEYLGSSD